MLVHCKSVPILDENYSDRTRYLFSNRASSYWVRTTFAMNDVRDHAFELPVYGHSSHWQHVPLTAAWVFLLLWLAAIANAFLHDNLLSDYIVPWVDYLQYRYVRVGVVLAIFAVAISYYFSCRRAKKELMNRAAREERGLKSSDRLKVVETKDWDKFVESLR